MTNNRPELVAFKQIYQSLETINDAAQLPSFWFEAVVSFSQCYLTREEDKLVALSGVAKEIKAKLPNTQYFAGLWGLDMELQLLWLVDDQSNGEHSRRPQHYRAPSWSWARSTAS